MPVPPIDPSLVIGGQNTQPRARQPKEGFEVGHYLIAICLCLSVGLIYFVNFGTVNISLFWLISLIALPFVLGTIRTHLIMQVGLGLLALQLLSLFWSPRLWLGVNDCLGMTSFLVMLGLGLRYGAEGRTDMSRLIRIYCQIALIQSVLVIALRIDSQFGYHLSSLFYRGDQAILFFEQNILAIFLGGDGWGVDVNPHQLNTMGGIYNVYGDRKAGGFELNGNIAGAWSGLLAFLSLGVFDRSKPLRWAAIVLIHIAAVIASGSKASLLLLATIPAVVALIRFAPRTIPLPFLAACAGAICLVLAALWLLREPLTALLGGQNAYARDTLEASQCRKILLEHARLAISTDWLWGHGYGGWRQTYDQPYAFKHLCLVYKVPPHNAFILLWTQSGLAAMLAGIAIYGLGLMALGKAFIGRNDPLMMGAFAACLFVVLQAMGENISLFSSLHVTAPIALLMGFGVAEAKRLRASRPF